MRSFNIPAFTTFSLRYLFLEGFQRVLLRQGAAVGYELHEPGDEEEAGDEEAGYIEQAQCLAADSPFDIFERSIYEYGVNQDDNQSQFGGAQFTVGKQEFAFDDGRDIGINREHQITGQYQHGYIEAEHRRQTGTDTHDADGDGIERVVDKESVDRALRIAHTCQRAVEAVAVPVDEQTQ